MCGETNNPKKRTTPRYAETSADGSCQRYLIGHLVLMIIIYTNFEPVRLGQKFDNQQLQRGIESQSIMAAGNNCNHDRTISINYNHFELQL